MERLTFDGNFCDIAMCRESPCPYNGMCSQREIWERLKKYEDAGLAPEEIKKHEAAYNECLTRTYGPFKQKISQWLQAEQTGRLVVLPSKTVWELTMDAGPDCDLKCPVDAYDEALGCDLCSKAKPFAYERPCTQERLKGLGKTVYLTREEAEAALAQEGASDGKENT